MNFVRYLQFLLKCVYTRLINNIVMTAGAAQMALLECGQLPIVRALALQLVPSGTPAGSDAAQ